jgi:hypothetical protein
MNTLVKRLALEGKTSLEERIQNLCDVHLIAGYRLAAMQVIDSNIILVFQRLRRVKQAT